MRESMLCLYPEPNPVRIGATVIENPAPAGQNNNDWTGSESWAFTETMQTFFRQEGCFPPGDSSRWLHKSYYWSPGWGRVQDQMLQQVSRTSAAQHGGTTPLQQWPLKRQGSHARCCLGADEGTGTSLPVRLSGVVSWGGWFRQENYLVACPVKEKSPEGFTNCRSILIWQKDRRETWNEARLKCSQLTAELSLLLQEFIDRTFNGS